MILKNLLSTRRGRFINFNFHLVPGLWFMMIEVRKFAWLLASPLSLFVCVPDDYSRGIIVFFLARMALRWEFNPVKYFKDGSGDSFERWLTAFYLMSSTCFQDIIFKLILNSFLGKILTIHFFKDIRLIKHWFTIFFFLQRKINNFSLSINIDKSKVKKCNLFCIA